jgi:hypothetical protein
MLTIGGGIVKYVDVQLLPCPDEPTHVGQCLNPARIDLMWQDRIVESFPLRAGDELLVSDGADVPPETALIAREDWRRCLRADIPDGVEATVRWSEELVETSIDEVTGISRVGFAHGAEPVVLELVANDVEVARFAIERDAIPIAMTGARVHRGDRLAWLMRNRRMRDLDTGIETVRAFLDARRLDHEPTALVAPRDATVIDIGQRWVVLRTTDERVLRLRVPPRTSVIVSVGETVVAGDALTDGERNHRALLHAWGAHRLGEHIIDELSLFVGDKVPRVYWALALRAMLASGKLSGIGALARARRSKVQQKKHVGVPHGRR